MGRTNWQRRVVDRRWGMGVAIALWVLFIGAYPFARHVDGLSAAALTTFPIFVAGFALGLRGGVLIGTANAILNIGLFAYSGRPDWPSNLDILVRIIIGIAIPAITGKFGDVYRELLDRTDELAHGSLLLQREVAERELVEKALVQARDDLDRRINERTAALRESEARYRVISEMMSDYAFSARVEPDGRPVTEWVVGAFSRITGYDLAETDRWDQIIHPQDREALMARLHATWGQDSEQIVRSLTKSGQVRWLSARIHPEWDAPHTRVVRLFGAVQDISERMSAQESLRASEARSQALVNAIPDMMIRLDRTGTVLDVKPGRAARWVMPANAMIGRRVDDILAHQALHPIQAIHQLQDVIVAALEQGEPQMFESQVPMGDTSRFYETRVVISGPDEALAIIRDITDRKRAEADRERLFQEVRNSQEQLAAVSQRLVETEELERRQIAQELHDQVGQNLTGLSINLNIIGSQVAGQNADAIRRRVTDSLHLVDATVARIRDVMAELRPAVLDDYGLLAGLRWLATRFSERICVPAVVEGNEFVPRLSPSHETALFRIAQEALNNVAKHAHASHVTIRIETVGASARMTISDDGVGFAPAESAAGQERMSWGLKLMHERARGAGGDLTIVSARSRGTTLTIQIPR